MRPLRPTSIVLSPRGEPRTVTLTFAGDDAEEVLIAALDAHAEPPAVAVGPNTDSTNEAYS